MLIICPKCFAQYSVDERKFKSETQVFQCTACGHRFEERVHFDDEKNTQNDVSEPAQASVSPLQIPVYQTQSVPQEAPVVDFTPHSTGVLPEEFMPVNDTPPSKGRKIAYVIVMMLILIAVGTCAYVWLNREALLKQYPHVQKAWTLLTTPEQNSQPNNISDKQPDTMTPDTQLNNDVIQDVQVLQVPSIQTLPDEPIISDLQVKPAKQNSDAGQMKDRILPVEAEPVILPETQGGVSENVVIETSESKTQTANTQEDRQAEDVPPAEIVSPDNRANETAEQPAVLPQINQEEEIILEEIPMPTDMPMENKTPQLNDTLTDASKVRIHDVSFKYDMENEATPRLFVQGVVSNVTNDIIKMPPLQVQLFDANGTVLGIKELPYAQTDLGPNGEEFFFYDLSDVPAGLVAKINVTVKGK